MLAACSSKRT